MDSKWIIRLPSSSREELNSMFTMFWCWPIWDVIAIRCGPWQVTHRPTDFHHGPRTWSRLVLADRRNLSTPQWCFTVDPRPSDKHVKVSGKHKKDVRFPKHSMNGLYGCFHKWWYPQIIHLNRFFHHLKMSFLFKMGIFHCYVCLPEGKVPQTLNEWSILIYIPTVG